MLKRIIAVASSAMLALSLIPFAAFADSSSEDYPAWVSEALERTGSDASASDVSGVSDSGKSNDADASDDSAVLDAADVQPVESPKDFSNTLTSTSSSVAGMSRYNYPATSANALSDDAADLPESFDLRELDAVTSTKNQGGWGTCWTFASLASLESNLLLQHAVEGEPDFSERHLSYFARIPLTEQDDAAQAGEGAFIVNTTEDVQWTPTQLTLNSGGDTAIAAAALASWYGAADEKDAPYQPNGGTSEDIYELDTDWTLPAEDRTLSEVHVQNVEFLPSPATFSDPTNPSTGNYIYDQRATDAIKRTLMENGAVSIMYHADTTDAYIFSGEWDKPDDPDDPLIVESLYMSWTNCAQYVFNYISDVNSEWQTTANHGVTVVGWDDSYPRENFSNLSEEEYPGKCPPADGAWIVKNSWGVNDTGHPWVVDEEGYFYLSYYDMSIIGVASFTGDARDADGSFDYDSNYQYDYLGVGSVGKVEPGSFEGDVAGANVFTAEGDETLRAVSASTANPGSTVDVQVYLLDEDAATPTDGELVAQQTEEIEFGGYHTIELDNSVALEEGQRFSVVESIEGYQGDYLPLEVAAHDPNDPDESLMEFVTKKVQVAVANEGESFYSQDGGATWTDATELTADDLQSRVSLTGFYGSPDVTSVGNVMIKAFTTDGIEDEPENPSDPDDPAGGDDSDNPDESEEPGGSAGEEGSDSSAGEGNSGDSAGSDDSADGTKPAGGDQDASSDATDAGESGSFATTNDATACLAVIAMVGALIAALGVARAAVFVRRAK